jgi:hypothetical protein
MAPMALLCTLIASAAQGQPRCTVELGPAYYRDIIEPVLRDKLGDALVYYRTNAPAVVKNKRSIDLLYNPSRTVHGSSLMSETTLVIEIDKCTGRVLRSYEALPP